MAVPRAALTVVARTWTQDHLEEPCPSSRKTPPRTSGTSVAAIDRGGQLDDYTVDFVTIRESHSLASLLKGLPGDSCQCPHWGYMLAGKITVSYPDHEEVYQAGDAFYMTPGHVPAAEAGSEFIQFSPKQELAETIGRDQGQRRADDGGRLIRAFRPGSQARAAGPRLVIWAAMIDRWTSLVPSQIRSTRSSRKKRSATFSRM